MSRLGTLDSVSKFGRNELTDTFVVDLAVNASGEDQFRIRIFKDGALVYDSDDFAAGLLEDGTIKVKR